MRWDDEGIFLAGRPHGETSAIANIFTREHGRSFGLVKGGRSRRLRPLLQTGNVLQLDWRARLEGQLGVFTIELKAATAADVMDNALALAGMASVCALLQILPESDPHPALYDTSKTCLNSASDASFAAAIVRFELTLLSEMGFGLNLKSCAATDTHDDLIYVSPRSAQAVCREAGDPFRAKLLKLPGFLIEDASHVGDVTRADVAEGLVLTGYFLQQHIFANTSQAAPRAREDFLRLIVKI